MKQLLSILFLFGFRFYVPVNSYGHVKTVHLTTLFTGHACNWQQPSLQKEENDRNYFMINLH